MRSLTLCLACCFAWVFLLPVALSGCGQKMSSAAPARGDRMIEIEHGLLWGSGYSIVKDTKTGEEYLFVQGGGVTRMQSPARE